MENWKKYALASASVLALGATLAACGNLTGDNQKSSKSEDGKTVIKMYQIGDKPANLDTLLANANKIITSERFVAAMTIIPSFPSKPSISIKSWFKVCSRSSLPPPRPTPR